MSEPDTKLTDRQVDDLAEAFARRVRAQFRRTAAGRVYRVPADDNQ